MMASALVGASLQGLPTRRTVGRIAAVPRMAINPAHPKIPITVQSRPVSSDKPLVSGNGISCSIQLAEPHVYLTGFDYDGRGHIAQNTSAIIRGKMIVKVQKSAKIKAITLRFYGRARTEWPEGIPPSKSQFHEEEKLRYQVLPFYNALYSSADVGYGAQCTYVLRTKEASSSTRELAPAKSPTSRSIRSSTILSARDQKRLSLQTVQSRSFQKGDSAATTTQQKGYKVFHPGVYEYSFEITLDHSCPETMNLPMGSVRWMLEAIVERAGTFKPNLHGTKEVTIVRAPDQNSLEQVEPIAISRKWEDQLHYDIVISGKSFPIGSKIPIAFKLTPLAKVQCHRIKVYVTENVDYFCKDKKITRKDAQRKVLLLERNAGKPLGSEYTGSDVRIMSGGELDGPARARARMQAENSRERFAKHTGTTVDPLGEPVDNLLGDLDLGLDHLITQTEIEMDVQLPTCEQMLRDRSKMLHPDTTYKNIQVHHWIKIVMRLSRVDVDNPTKRRHFEISIDSPFHILSCLATQAHTSLPEYHDSNPGTPSHTFECGCPNAAATANASPVTSAGSLLPTGLDNPGAADVGADGNALSSLAVPAQAHLASNGAAPLQRPMHMIRVPSYNPPSFEADDPPPPLETPPPMYDAVVGTPSHDGLADYFARLADVYTEDADHSDEELDLGRAITRTGRVNVPNPRTPGNRTTSRSMDISRTFMFRPETFNPRLRGARGGMPGQQAIN